MEEREPTIKILYENTTRPVNRVLLTFPLSGREKPEQKMLSLTEYYPPWEPPVSRFRATRKFLP